MTKGCEAEAGAIKAMLENMQNIFRNTVWFDDETEYIAALLQYAGQIEALNNV